MTLQSPLCPEPPRESSSVVDVVEVATTRILAVVGAGVAVVGATRGFPFGARVLVVTAGTAPDWFTTLAAAAPPAITMRTMAIMRTLTA
jgi:hypothetical protein